MILALLTPVCSAQLAVVDTTDLVPGRYYYVVEVNTDGSVSFTPIRIVLKLRPSDTPDPGPGPGPTPKPDGVPLGDYGLTKLAFVEASKLPPEARKLAQEISENFVAEAAQIAAGSRENIPESGAQLREKNRETVGELRPAWLDFFVVWQEAVSAQVAAGQIVSLDDYAKAYLSTAAGLKLVK
jgi:hypothetical protein